MALPSSVKIKKDGIEYLNNVDACKYTIKELIRMALRDSGKLICRRTKQDIKAFVGKKQYRYTNKRDKKRYTKTTGGSLRSIQYWVRQKEDPPDLLVGFKPFGFNISFFELGTGRMAKKGFLFNTVKSNIETIKNIQAQYLSALNEDNPSIDTEKDYEGGAED